MNITKKLITSNNKGKAQTNHPKYIVIHDTGNTSKTATADNHYRWLQNTSNTNASAHIFVDDHQAIQIIEYTTPAWHTGKLYVAKPQVPDCTNFNSIGIEFCINQGSDLKQTLSNTVSVISQIMKQLHIPIERVITHQMSAGKSCPGTFIHNPNLYQQFMADLKVANSQAINPAITQALDYLKAQRIITDTSYWQNQVQQVAYLDAFLFNVVSALQKAKE